MGKWTLNSSSLKYLRLSIPFPCCPRPMAGQPQPLWWHPHGSLCKAGQQSPTKRNCSGHTWDAVNANVLRVKPSYLHTCLHLLSTYLLFSSLCATGSGINRSQHSKSSLTSVQSYISLTFIIITFVSKPVKHEINFETHSTGFTWITHMFKVNWTLQDFAVHRPISDRL